MRHVNKLAWALFALAMNGCATTHGGANGQVTYEASGSPRQVPNLVVASAAAEVLMDDEGSGFRNVTVTSSRDGVTVNASSGPVGYGLAMPQSGVVLDPRELESMQRTEAARMGRTSTGTLPPIQGRTTSGAVPTGADPIVKCPTDRAPVTVAEQAACADASIKAHLGAISSK